MLNIYCKKQSTLNFFLSRETPFRKGGDMYEFRSTRFLFQECYLPTFNVRDLKFTYCETWRAHASSQKTEDVLQATTTLSSHTRNNRSL